MNAAVGAQRHASSEAEAMARLVSRLRQQFPELDTDQIERAVQGRYAEFDGRPVRDFVPILVERSAYRELSGRSTR
jgi:hypothetical protein